MAEGYDIVTAKEEVERIAEFLRHHFYKQSPLNLADRQMSDMFPL
jgi:hypothetical protein